MDEPVAREAPAPPAAVAAGEPEPVQGPSRWRWPARLAALALVAGVLGLLGWATLSAARGGSLVARIAAGEKPAAPTFDLVVAWPRTATWPPELRAAPADRRLALSELRGRPAVVNFWASWCLPCRDEAPILNAAARARQGRVAFLGVNVQDLESDALAFLREFDPPYVSVRDRGNRTYRDYGLTGVPETYYLDAAGRIVAHAPGAVSRRTLADGIEAALASRSR